MFSKKWISSFRCSRDHGWPKLESFSSLLFRILGGQKGKHLMCHLCSPSNVKQREIMKTQQALNSEGSTRKNELGQWRRNKSRFYHTYAGTKGGNKTFTWRSVHCTMSYILVGPQPLTQEQLLTVLRERRNALLPLQIIYKIGCITFFRTV